MTLAELRLRFSRHGEAAIRQAAAKIVARGRTDAHSRMIGEAAGDIAWGDLTGRDIGETARLSLATQRVTERLGRPPDETVKQLLLQYELIAHVRVRRHRDAIRRKATEIAASLSGGRHDRSRTS